MSFFGEIYADPDLPHRARTVYMYLRDRAGGGSCWPGIKTIARDLHLSPRTVQRALNDLEHAGYIQRQRRHRENGSCTSNLYIKIIRAFSEKCAKIKERNRLFRCSFLKGTDSMRNGVKVPANRSL